MHFSDIITRNNLYILVTELVLKKRFQNNTANFVQFPVQGSMNKDTLNNSVGIAIKISTVSNENKILRDSKKSLVIDKKFSGID
jgi:hypothetical protein